MTTTDPAPSTGGTRQICEKASMGDVPQLLKLINGYAAEGIMLARTEFEISENIRDFSVIRIDGQLAGCAALHFYTPLTGEIRSLAVDPALKGRGAGRDLIQALEAEAQAFGLQSVFAFTYIPGFFAKLGFREIERGELPLKAWKDCLRCPKFQCCDEISVIKHFEADHTRGIDPRIRGVAFLGNSAGDGLVLLPEMRKPR